MRMVPKYRLYDIVNVSYFINGITIYGGPPTCVVGTAQRARAHTRDTPGVIKCNGFGILGAA